MAVKKDEDVQALTVADLIAALRTLKGDDDETLQRRAKYEAEAHARLTRKENEQHPGISVYSYPEGDVARPKAPLKCEMFWVGYPLEVEGLTPTEVDLLNQADEGEFVFHRTDGAFEKLSVKGQTDTHGRLRRLEFYYPCRGENRNNLPSMTALLREAYGRKSQEQLELDALREQVATLSAVVASA